MGRSGDALRHRLAENRLGGAAGNSWEKLEMPNELLWSQAMTALLTPTL